MDPQQLREHVERGNRLVGQGSFAEAEAVYRQVLPFANRFPEIAKNLADTLLRQQRFAEAETHYRAALKIRPTYSGALINLAHACVCQGRFDQAVKHYEQALDLDSTSMTVRRLYAKALASAGRPEAAWHQYERLLRDQPDRAELHAEAGVVLGKLGQLVRAEEHLARAITIDPRRPAWFHDLALIHRFSIDDPYIDAMRSLGDDPSFRPADNFSLLFGLGTALDQTGQFEEAFVHFQAANAAKRAVIEYNEKAELAHLRLVQRRCDAKFLRSVEPYPRSDFAPIFIVGMPRSGSTLVEQILSQHSRALALGEVLYFSDGINAAGVAEGSTIDDTHFDPKRLAQAGHDYKNRIESLHGPVDGRLVTDKMLSNFKYLGLLHAALPHAKVIHTRRRPLDTCLSCYVTNFQDGMAFAYNLAELGRYYKDYEAAMDHWQQTIPAKHILDCDYEEVVADPGRMARKIVEFCGFEWEDRCLRFFESKRPVLTASLAQVRRPIHSKSIDRWRAYERHLGPLIKALSRPEPAAGNPKERS